MPVYNSSQYLAMALKSVLEQSYTDFELLLINDGSKDKSKEICLEFAKNDKRIIFIDKENEGVSISRNRCLEVAKGEYVLFVDSDDVIYPDSLKKIHDVLCRYEPDFLRFEYQYIDRNGNDLYPNYGKMLRKKKQFQVVDPVVFFSKIMGNEFFLCVNCYKRSIIVQHGLKLKVGCTFNEDTLFVCHFLKFCKRCIYIPNKVYGYRKTSNAVTMNFTMQNANDVLGVFFDLNRLADSSNQSIADCVKRVSQYLLLNLYEHRILIEERNMRKAIEICLQKPLLTEWILYKKMPSIAVCLWRVLNMKRKVVRKIKYYL